MVWEKNKKIKFKILFIILCLCGVRRCMCVYHSIWCVQKQEEGMGSPGTGVIGSFELPCVHWGLIPGPLQKAAIALNHKVSSPASEGGNF